MVALMPGAALPIQNPAQDGLVSQGSLPAARAFRLRERPHPFRGFLPHSSLTLQSRLQVKPDKHAFGIGKIADDFLNGCRKAAHQGGDGDDLVAAGQLRTPEQIDDFDAISSAHVGFADLFQIAERRDGIGSVAGNVEAEFPCNHFRLCCSACRPLAGALGSRPAFRAA